MSSGKIVVITLLAGVVSVGAGILGHRYLNPTQVPEKSREISLIPQPIQLLTKLPDFTLPDLEGNPIQSDRWPGKILVLNFWATWCEPCRREIPAFMALQEEMGAKGLQFVGIAIDTPEDTRKFADTHDINYPILIAGMEAIEMSRQLGNRYQGLPFSVIFDPKGKIIYAQAGELKPETIRDKIGALL